MSPSSSPPGDEPAGPSLREIAHHLTTPARGGMVLTKARIAELGGSLGLPAGLGEKSQMLMALFRAAADLDTIPALVEALRIEAERWDRRYTGWAAEYPASAAIWREWRGRLGQTHTILAEMAEAVEQATPNEPLEQSPMPRPIEDEVDYVD